LASQRNLDGWAETPRGCLALIILLDQFSRNIFRGSPEAFSQDKKARETLQSALARGLDKQLHDVEKWFFYMPLMHSENFGDQKDSVAIFKRLIEECVPALELALAPSHDYAVRHFDIVKRFGRYPHRNKILGRISTPEEVEFLKQPGSSF